MVEPMNKACAWRVAIWLSLCVCLALAACGGGPPLQPWHTLKLDGEFQADMLGEEVRNFKEYIVLEDDLFQQLDETVYAETPTDAAYGLSRYSAGSASDPRRWDINWNRSFQIEQNEPRGAVLLLHGMSDSPYSLRALGQSLHRAGYTVLGLRLPGHGTVPSGLRFVEWEDMAAAVSLAMDHLQTEIAGKEIHIIGYSTGATLALDYVLDALETGHGAMPASLVLISPAIRVHAAGAWAWLKDAFSALPGLSRWAYLDIMDEFDPFKYNSFATNAGGQVHELTLRVDGRIDAVLPDGTGEAALPPILALKSAVDATVTTDAIVGRLLKRLPESGNELVLFDVNRDAAVLSTILVDDPGPLTEKLLDDEKLPFAVSFVTNKDESSRALVVRYKPPYSARPSASAIENLDLQWPNDIVSLSHVALPFPPDDPLYGRTLPADDTRVFLGDLAIKGERGLIKLPADWLLRLRYNPFYSYLEHRVQDWLEEAPGSAPRIAP